VEAGRAWLLLPAIDETLPACQRLATEIFAEMAAKVAKLRRSNRRLDLVISPAHAQAACRTDAALSCLWQIRGHRRLRVDPEPRAAGGPEAFDLAPGRMATWLPNAPHGIENGPGLNVSLFVRFTSPRRLGLWKAPPQNLLVPFQLDQTTARRAA
jgi:hypothetical protein